MHKPFPPFGLWFSYPLSKAALVLKGMGWQLKAHILVLGPVAFAVIWRRCSEPAAEEQR